MAGSNKCLKRNILLPRSETRSRLPDFRKCGLLLETDIRPPNIDGDKVLELSSICLTPTAVKL